VLDRLPIRTPVAAVKQAILGPSRYRLNRTTCFACFIRLRSGIANSPKRTARSSGRYARKYHAIMASAWLGSPQLELIGVLGRDPVGPAASARAVGRRPETPERRSFFRHPRESGGPGGRPRPLWPWIPAVAGMPGNADHRRLDTLAGAEQVDRPPVRCQEQALREVAGALGGDQYQRAAAIGHQAALQQSERVGDYPRVQHVLDGDRRLEGGARVGAGREPVHTSPVRRPV